MLVSENVSIGVACHRPCNNSRVIILIIPEWPEYCAVYACINIFAVYSVAQWSKLAFCMNGMRNGDICYLYRSDTAETNIIITANDIAEPPNATLPTMPLHPNLAWPTPTGVNETEARRICQAPILQSPVFSLCQNFTLHSLEVITESCMLDLLVW